MTGRTAAGRFLPVAGWSLVFGLPAVIVMARALPMGQLSTAVSGLTLADLPPDVLAQIGYVMAIPLGAVVVVIARVSLGLRLMGPFRPILIAVALQMTGIVPGLLFLAATFLLITLVRPLVKAQKLPYFARTAVLLSIVALFTILVLLAGKWFDLAGLLALAHFPVVVLCLAAEAFARTLSGEGVRSAAWRGMLTGATALLIALLIAAPGVLPVLVAHPELVLMMIGLAALIGRHLAFRALDHLNPKPVHANAGRRRRKRAALSKSRNATVATDEIQRVRRTG
ncbi:MAG: hypothetical protein MJE12_09430 [Alphaproteobacteria bacterium]|nr:hypothetical protein [Alphaproteobacteria bacterium]